MPNHRQDFLEDLDESQQNLAHSLSRERKSAGQDQRPAQLSWGQMLDHFFELPVHGGILPRGTGDNIGRVSKNVQFDGLWRTIGETGKGFGRNKRRAKYYPNMRKKGMDTMLKIILAVADIVIDWFGLFDLERHFH